MGRVRGRAVVLIEVNPAAVHQAEANMDEVVRVRRVRDSRVRRPSHAPTRRARACRMVRATNRLRVRAHNRGSRHSLSPRLKGRPQHNHKCVSIPARGGPQRRAAMAMVRQNGVPTTPRPSVSATSTVRSWIQGRALAVSAEMHTRCRRVCDGIGRALKYQFLSPPISVPRPPRMEPSSLAPPGRAAASMRPANRENGND